MPEGNEIVEKSYVTAVTDERLMQVIYTCGKGKYKRWVWNACTIEKE
jgi:hypothetical protein